MMKGIVKRVQSRFTIPFSFTSTTLDVVLTRDDVKPKVCSFSTARPRSLPYDCNFRDTK